MFYYLEDIERELIVGSHGGKYTLSADVAEKNLGTSLGPNFGILELLEIGLEEVTDSNSRTLESDATNHKNDQHQKRESSCHISSFSSALNSFEDAAENDEPKNGESADNRRTKRSHLAKTAGNLKHFVGPILGLGKNYSAVAIFWLDELIIFDVDRAAFCVPSIVTRTPWNFTPEKSFYNL